MARYFSTARTESLTLESATAEGLTWDVFVSHTSEDDDLAEEVARCIESYGLTAWVDSDFFDAEQDGPEMASKIQAVIDRFLLPAGCRDERDQRLLVGSV